MATSADTQPCSICMVKKQTNVSTSWCPECEDALCPGCDEHHSISKGTRNHSTIPIDDYVKLPTFILNVKLVCEEHDEKCQHYCKTHESPLCRKCITTTHSGCRDIAVLDDVTSNIKTSSIVDVIQKDTEDVCRRIRKMQDDRQANYDKIQKQKTSIIKEIFDARSAINKHLDKIQNGLLRKLKSDTEKQFKHIEDLINKLKDRENQMTEMQENLSKIIKYASDYQIFYGIKQIEKQVLTVEEYIQSSCDDGSLKQVDICCDINKQIRDITVKIRKFGDIDFKSAPAIINMKSLREKQAQLQVTKATMVNKKQLTSLQRLNTFSSIGQIRCCCLLSNGNIAFGDYHYTVNIYRMDGTKQFAINLKNSNPVEITTVDDETIAVSTGKTIVLINTKRGNIKRTVDIGVKVLGITFKDGCVVYCEEDKGVSMIDLKSSKITVLLRESIDDPSYITTFGTKSRKFALSEERKKTVRVFDPEMKELWRLSDTDYLQIPCYLFVDSQDFCYVLDWKSNSVVCISPSRKDHSILKFNDCTFKAVRMSFNPTLGQLLVLTVDHEVLIFKI